jgi:hypothetical protein
MDAARLDTVNGVPHSAMALAHLARLLFGLALLAQIAASAHAPTANGGSRFCAMTHGEARAQSHLLGGASEQAPQRETGRGHSLCSFCLFGSGVPPLLSRMLALEAFRVAAEQRISFDYFEGLAFFHSDRNASARAPPSFS